MNRDHTQKLGQSDLVYSVYRLSQKMLMQLCCQLSFTTHGLLVLRVMSKYLKLKRLHRRDGLQLVQVH